MSISEENRLKPILEQRQLDVTAAKSARPIGVLSAQIGKMPAPRGFRRALLERHAATGRPAAIAEIKRASPSAGTIREVADVPGIAKAYKAAGATCLSVLTEQHYFKGSFDDLLAARAVVDLPIIAKDFVVDPYQLLEARAAGADAVLLIVAALEHRTASFLERARSIGLDALVEVHDAGELDIAITAGADLIGVNNRNLTTFNVDLITSERLLPRLPAGVVGVAESGLSEPAHVDRMSRVGAKAVLVGSALMSSAEPGAALAKLLGTAAGRSAAE